MRRDWLVVLSSTANDCEMASGRVEKLSVNEGNKEKDMEEKRKERKWKKQKMRWEVVSGIKNRYR